MLPTLQSWGDRTQRHVGLSSHCYIAIQGRRCWYRLSDPACFLAKAAGSLPAGSPLLLVRGPYLDLMQKDLTRAAIHCGVHRQVLLAVSLAPGLITGLQLVSTSSLLEHPNSCSGLISCIFTSHSTLRPRSFFHPQTPSHATQLSF